MLSRELNLGVSPKCTRICTCSQPIVKSFFKFTLKSHEGVLGLGGMNRGGGMNWGWGGGINLVSLCVIFLYIA